MTNEREGYSGMPPCRLSRRGSEGTLVAWMGEVYRARGTRLNRDNAMKVLAGSVAGDPERLGRFESETRVLASLSHPCIGVISGLEESGDTKAPVLEIVEGPTLADRIAEGPLPLEKPLSIARQVSGAVEAAHERGIVHRDLEPADIKARPGAFSRLRRHRNSSPQ